jgi:AraC-like DNA-binding protein
MTQCGREATLGDGDAILLSCSDVGAVTRPSACRYLGVRVPRTVLAALVPDIEDLVAVPIPRGSPGLALLQNYVSGLLSAVEGSAAPAVHRLATGHIYDLLALTLVAPSGRAIVTDNGGVRAARLRAIKNDIDAGLFSYELSIRSVALKQGVTPRYVQKLFEQEGLSFTEFVRERRLAQAHGLLGDRRFAHLSIGTIAFECGFNDLSYFNRTFRRRYGATPSDVREQARHDRR